MHAFSIHFIFPTTGHLNFVNCLHSYSGMFLHFSPKASQLEKTEKQMYPCLAGTQHCALLYTAPPIDVYPASFLSSTQHKVRTVSTQVLLGCIQSLAEPEPLEQASKWCFFHGFGYSSFLSSCPDFLHEGSVNQINPFFLKWFMYSS